MMWDPPIKPYFTFKIIIFRLSFFLLYLIQYYTSNLTLYITFSLYIKLSIHNQFLRFKIMSLIEVFTTVLLYWKKKLKLIDCPTTSMIPSFQPGLLYCTETRGSGSILISFHVVGLFFSNNVILKNIVNNGVEETELTKTKQKVVDPISDQADFADVTSMNCSNHIFFLIFFIYNYINPNLLKIFYSLINLNFLEILYS